MAKRLYYGVMELRHDVENDVQDVHMVTRTYDLDAALSYVNEINSLLTDSDLFVEEFVEEYTEGEFNFSDLYDEEE